MRAREQQKIHEAYSAQQALRRLRGLVPPAPVSQLCAKHPAWAPNLTGKAPPPRSSCPFCQKEQLGNRPQDRPRFEPVRVRDSEPPVPPSQWEKVQAFMEAQPEKFGDGLTQIERERLIEMADAAREEERERERHEAARRGSLFGPRVVVDLPPGMRMDGGI